jgi:Protein of unknown function (DUF3738)
MPRPHRSRTLAGFRKAVCVRLLSRFRETAKSLIQIAAQISLAALPTAHRSIAAQSAPGSVAATPAALPPMPADADPAFEVVTIKPSDAQSQHGTFFTTRGRHSIASNVTVIDLISYAYGLHTRQIVDGPAWLATTRFEIDGVPDMEGHPNRKQSRLMFQKLLATRFKLAFHHASRELPVYAVVLAKDGPPTHQNRSQAKRQHRLLLYQPDRSHGSQLIHG